MGTVKLPSKAHAAVLVEYELLIKRPQLLEWIAATANRTDDYQWVLMVSDHANIGTDKHDLFEWDVVIANSGQLEPNHFRRSAIVTVKEFSNLIPVMALADYEDRDFYIAQTDVLVVMSE